MDRYAIPRHAVTAALGIDGMGITDYDATIFGLVHDGVGWRVMEDSLEDEASALAWADRVAAYGEQVGLYVYAG